MGLFRKESRRDNYSEGFRLLGVDSGRTAPVVFLEGLHFPGSLTWIGELCLSDTQVARLNLYRARKLMNVKSAPEENVHATGSIVNAARLARVPRSWHDFPPVNRVSLFSPRNFLTR